MNVNEEFKSQIIKFRIIKSEIKNPSSLEYILTWYEFRAALKLLISMRFLSIVAVISRKLLRQRWKIRSRILPHAVSSSYKMLPGYGLRIHEIVISFCTPAKHYVRGIPTTSRKYKQLGKLRTREPILLKLPAALIWPCYRFSEKYRR